MTIGRYLTAVGASAISALALGVPLSTAAGQSTILSQSNAGQVTKPGWAGQVAPGRPRARGKSKVRATALRLTGDGERTHVEIDVTHAIVASVFVLGEPYRAVVDVPDLEFRLRVGATPRAHGIVKAYRYGQFEAGRSRIVFDSEAPLRIEQAMFSPPARGRTGVLRFDLVRIPAGQFLGVSRTAPADKGPAQPQGLRAGRFDDIAGAQPGSGHKDAGKRKPSRPVVLIDAGHGGLDPGTVSANNVTEKSVVLAVALKLKALLRRSGRYDVRMTRDRDVFVSLKERLRLSRAFGADLFISVHADALAEKDLAASVRGATIYTLSEKASDAAARALAEKENAADLLAGLDSVPASDEDQVRSILIDLVRRETSNFSTEMRRLLVKSMRGKVQLSKEPQRAASFMVLRQAETPAVLIELGYMSNPADLARLRRADWQQQAAVSITAAVDVFFDRHKSIGRR